MVEIHYNLRFTFAEFCDALLTQSPVDDSNSFGSDFPRNAPKVAESGIKIESLRCTLGQHEALKSLDLTIETAEMVALIGASGAGKSTLLRCIAGLTTADRGSGKIQVGDTVVQRDGVLAKTIRRSRAQIGFVFQQFNLVNRLSLLTNVLTGHLSRVPVHRRTLGLFSKREKLEAMHALHSVGLVKQALQRADTLSGGQQQRAAIARVIVQGARLILADEPIASLDPESARIVMTRLRDLNQVNGVTVVVSMHQIEQSQRYCDRLVGLRDGRVFCDCPSDQIESLPVTELYQRATG